MSYIMLTRIIPSSGEKIPAVGLGTWERFDVKAKDSKRAELKQVLSTFLAGGARLIDSSPMYGAAEGVVGDLLGEMPPEPKPFLATKVWTQGKQPGISQMQRSIELMGAERLDLMQIHNLVDWRVHLETLRAWKEQGRVRYIGITHYTESAHAELASVMRAAPWDFVQLNYSLEEQAAAKRLLPLAAECGMAVIVNRPFGGGGLIRRLQGKALPEWATAAGYGSWAELLLKFILAEPAVSCVIPGTGNPAHMGDILKAGEGELPDAALRKRMQSLVA